MCFTFVILYSILSRYIVYCKGDPTIHGNLECPNVLKDAIIEALNDHNGNGAPQYIYNKTDDSKSNSNSNSNNISIPSAKPSANANGYLPSVGSTAARIAIAEHFRYQSPNLPVRIGEDDIVIGSGCSGALEITINALINDGDNMLVPRPGFPLYEVLSNSAGGRVKPYRLDPSRDWQCDLEDLAAQIDQNTR